MKPRTFFLLSAVVASSIGCLALFAPDLLLEGVKGVSADGPSRVMARTTGALLCCIGAMDFLVRDHEDSPTLRAVLLANAFVHLGLMPIDPLAWATGTFQTLGSFLPNTVLHMGFASMALWLWRRPSA